MKTTTTLLAALVAVLAATTAHSQCDDPRDAVLCVHKLSDTEEGQFDHTSDAISAFWSDWAGKDYIELIPPDDCYPDRCGFTDPSDATITIKAAGTPKGLYLYLEVQDNTWVDRADADDIGADATDLFFDKMSADEIFTCTDCLIGLYSTTLTYTSQQFQVWMGATAPPAGFVYQCYDEQLWSWQATGLTWEAAAIIHGFRAKVVTVDPTHKTQEWFLPWQKFGKGIDIGTDLGGMRVAFAGGYNDKDGDNPSNHCLRWPNKKDPWAGDAQEVNYWGDLLLPADMGNVVQVVDDSNPVIGSSDGAGAVSTAEVVKTELFSLTGQKITREALNRLPAHTLLLKRYELTDGSHRTEMTRAR
ncbi:MAG: hypothetical protein GF331_04985 [Chitinivibrionales bacterium]|nr:hypothetical protein [Chitinivibrionales bacterium]